MSSQHSGNLLNQVVFEEHDGLLNAKKVSLVSSATIYAVVNTSAGGNVTVVMPGGATVFQGTDPWNVAVKGNVTLSDSKGFIGLTTVVQASTQRSIVGNLTLSDSKGYIGLVTSTSVQGGNWDVAITRGNVTVEQGDNPWVSSIVGNVTLSDPKTYIGLTTTTLGIGTQQIGSVTVSHPLSIAGNMTLSDSKNFIGLVTVVQSSSARTITGNITLSDAKTYIGLTTTTLGVGTTQIGSVTVSHPISIAGNITLSDPKGFIGLVTVVGSLSPAAGNVTLDPGSKTGIVGNVTISDSKGFIGLVTLGGGTAWADPKGFIGLVTIVGSLSPAAGNVTLDPGSKTGIVGNVTLSDAKTFIGLATTVNGAGDRFIGLVTAVTRNAGTTKTFVNLPLALSQGSIATIAVPTNAQKINITNLVLNSDATVRIAFKSGVTYLTGNATVGITLNPGGGWIQTGSPDSPSWIGLPSGAFVIEKLDLTGTSAKVGGNVIYFDE